MMRRAERRVARTHSLAGAVLVGLTVASFAVVTAIVVGSRPAWPHDAKASAAKPLGWSYPFSCCSGYDCREVPRSAISERPEGFVINGTGETLPYADTRLKNSPDGEYHWCSVAGAAHGKTICLFVPPKGF